jgi:hypothetical protein
MISHAKEGWEIDDLLPQITSTLKQLLTTDRIEDKASKAFADHIEVLHTAVDRYLADDYVSTASILYPRIEGLLRSFLRTEACRLNPSPRTLTKVAVERHDANRLDYSLLLPEKFNQYLDNVYFADFAPGSDPSVGRHSVAHGEARAEDFTLKTTTIAFLIIYQLTLFFSGGRTP